MTYEEIEKDWHNTNRDIEMLVGIVRRLETFIYESGGEDRTYLKVDLFKYKGLLSQAEELEEKIQEAFQKLETQTPKSEQPK